jgi:hypothetical protein
LKVYSSSPPAGSIESLTTVNTAADAYLSSIVFHPFEHVLNLRRDQPILICLQLSSCTSSIFAGCCRSPCCGLCELGHTVQRRKQGGRR